MNLITKILISLFLFLSLKNVFSTGARTHAEVGIRASYFFSHSNPIYRDMILKNGDVIIPSVNFPDWGFLPQCRPWDPCGRQSHSQDWVNYAVRYFHKKYGGKPELWSEETRKAAVFFFGAQSHEISDKLWHGSVSEYKKISMLETDGMLCFNGSFERSHENSDIGADIILTHQRPPRNVTWYIPAQDVLNIYNEMGYCRNISVEILEHCTWAIYVVMLATEYSGFLVPIVVDRSPFILEQIYKFQFGGVDDMAVRTALRWQALVKLFETGIIPDTKTMFPLDSASNLLQRSQGIEPSKEMKKLLHELFDIPESTFLKQVESDFSPKLVKTERGFEVTHHTWPTSTLSSFTKQSKFPAYKNQPREGPESYSYIGTSLKTLPIARGELDGYAFGQPGYWEPGVPAMGQVQISIPNHKLSHIVRKGPPLSRFGDSLLFVDFNQDGHLDLVVGAPGYEMSLDQKIQYPRGAVFIYFGNADGSFNEKHDILILGDDATQLQFTNIGTHLFSGDVNGDSHDDLLIGSPYSRMHRGVVTVFFSGRNMTSGMKLSNERQSNLILRGEKDHNWFGNHVEVVRIENQPPLLLISAPIVHRNQTSQTVGKLYGYDILQGGTATQLRFSVIGERQFDKFGFIFSVGRPFTDRNLAVIAVSSPSSYIVRRGAGIVYLLHLESLRGELALENCRVLTAFTGSQSHARFGWVLGFNDVNKDGFDDLFVSEPWKDSSSLDDIGEVVIFNGGNGFPMGLISNPSERANQKFLGDEQSSRFGFQVAFGRFQDGSNIIISSPMASSDVNSKGKLNINKV